MRSHVSEDQLVDRLGQHNDVANRSFWSLPCKLVGVNVLQEVCDKTNDVGLRFVVRLAVDKDSGCRGTKPVVL